MIAAAATNISSSFEEVQHCRLCDVARNDEGPLGTAEVGQLPASQTPAPTAEVGQLPASQSPAPTDTPTHHCPSSDDVGKLGISP